MIMSGKAGRWGAGLLGRMLKRPYWTGCSVATIGTAALSINTNDGDNGNLRHYFYVGVAAWPKDRQGSDNIKGKQPRREDCGEDAYVVAANQFQTVLGVADGVGSWRSKGIDPAQFSRTLMTAVADLLTERKVKEPLSLVGQIKSSLFNSQSSNHHHSNSNNDPENSDYHGKQPWKLKLLLRAAFWRLVGKFHNGTAQPFGSSTACLLSLDCRTGSLTGCNLGDSGYLIIRQGKVLRKSPIQQHRFNAPFQLTLTPDGDIHDCSAMAAEEEIANTREDDLVIVATDGLWDNLFEEDILQIVNETTITIDRGVKQSPSLTSASSSKEQEIARELVRRARMASEREDYESPFSVEAAKHGIRRLGGKIDDITIIVGRIYQQKAPHQQ